MTCPNCGSEMEYVAEAHLWVCTYLPDKGESGYGEHVGCGYEEDASVRDVSEPYTYDDLEVE